MNNKDEEFRNRLMATYKIEADEHITSLTSGLLDLEKSKPDPAQIKIVERIFREVHSLKGASRAVNFDDIESVCASLERIFAVWKNKNISLSKSIFDTLHMAVDHISSLLSTSEEDKSKLREETISLLSKVEEMDANGIIVDNEAEEVKNNEQENSYEKIAHQENFEIEKVDTGHTDTSTQVQKSAKTGIDAKPSESQIIPDTAETMRIPKSKLDTILMQAEEMLSVNLKLLQHTDELQNIRSSIDHLKKGHARLVQASQLVKHHTENGEKRNELSGISQYAKLQEIYNDNFGLIKDLDQKTSNLIRISDLDQRYIASMVNNLLFDVRKTMMLPFSTLLELFPKMVRDLSRDQGKEVTIEIIGRENEIDRRILEEMKDPLIHIIRNCIDHGIEKPAIRKSTGKPESGKITIAINQQSGNKVEILISDDGGGIDSKKVLEVAVKQGFITATDQEELKPEFAWDLIYRSGLSTSPIITELSGRGLGLAIAREKVENLNGSLSVESEVSKGTMIRIILPLTMATFRGIFVEVSGQVFAFPTTNVDRIFRVRKNEIKTVENKNVLSLNGKTVSFNRLDQVLEIPRQAEEEKKTKYFHVLVIEESGNRIAFGVDKILYEGEVLVKSFGKLLVRVRNCVGGTILGSGKVVPILNVSDLIKSAVKSETVGYDSAITEETEKIRLKSVCIAEDSITARMLLKNIFESAGFKVTTAVDGAEALSCLRENDFDILISDIDMPRLNGFELTKKVRADKKLGNTPVVLVTALKSREDRERGMEVGANAYMEKGSFDPQKLLEIVDRLV